MPIKYFKIIKARIIDKKKIILFIKKSFFKKNHILTKDSILFDWQYRNRDLSCSIALFKKKIMGLQFYIPLYQFDPKLKNNKEIFTSLWFTKKTNIISLGEKIFDYTIQSLKPKLIIAMGLPDYLIKFHIKKKFIIKKMVHSFVTSQNIKKNILKINKPTIGSSKKIIITQVNSKTELDKSNIKKLFKFQYPTKSIQYINNRYILHPVYKYHIYHIQFNKNKVLCVVRVIKIKNKNIIRLVDFIGQNNSFKHLTNFFLFILNKFKADYLDFYSFGIPKKILKTSGLHLKEDFNKLIVPNHFEPFENKNVDIFIGYLSKYIDNSKIRLFKADSDLDRPNLFY